MMHHITKKRYGIGIRYGIRYGIGIRYLALQFCSYPINGNVVLLQ